MTSARLILTVNAGSTSQKISLVHPDDEASAFSSLDEAFAAITPDVVAHRVVHGGEAVLPRLIDDAVLEDLRSLVELAPLHQPPALDAIDRCRAEWPGSTQVACFDTAFHATIPAAARTYALPERLRRLVRVYGFHGLSHEWAARRVAAVAPEARRIVVAHLGGGASLCAVRDGESVWTTMGFTPLDGLVMATRCGSLDPGALLWLAERTDEDLGAVLETESGLLGLAGTADMRQLLERVEQGHGQALDALDVYVHRLVTAFGSAVAVLSGLDAVAFTGGIGENAHSVRQAVAERLGWLGVAIEDFGPPHGAAPTEISAAHASVRTFVVEAHEDLQMAAQVRTLLDRTR